MHYISLCAIVKDEHPNNLQEFIAHHLGIGIEHCYIYDNGSSIPISNILKNYIDAGLVSVIYFPEKGVQMQAYSGCLNAFGKDNEFIAFIDMDELIIPKSHDNMQDFLRQYNSLLHLGSFAINWKIFGSEINGELAITKPNQLMSEIYIKSSNNEFEENKHIKSIVRPKNTKFFNLDPHHATLHNGYFNYNEKMQNIRGPFAQPCSTETIQINHYFTRSKEEWEKKVLKGRADVSDSNIPGREIHEWESFNNNCNMIEDCSALRFVNKTKEIMEKYRC